METEPLGCIYLITNLANGMMYVGQTQHSTPEPRYDQHWRESVKNRHNSMLYNSMRLHGRDQFKIETLCVVPHASLNNMEAYWAEQLETYIWDIPGGYNMVSCGDGGFGRRGIPNSPETRAKISAAQRGKPKTEEHNLKNSLANLGRKKSDAQCIKMAESMSKLTKEQVFEILDLYASGGMFQQTIAERFGISRRAVGMIVKGQTYKHIPRPTITPNEDKMKETLHARLSETHSNLSKDDVLEIRRLYAAGGISQQAVADKFNITREAARNIINRKVWTHI
jgi:group I intron endonuclease